MRFWSTWNARFGKVTSRAKALKDGALFEVHYKSCDCSMCCEIRGHRRVFGFQAPGLKHWNSWWWRWVRVPGAILVYRYHAKEYRDAGKA